MQNTHDASGVTSVALNKPVCVSVCAQTCFKTGMLICNIGGHSSLNSKVLLETKTQGTQIVVRQEVRDNSVGSQSPSSRTPLSTTPSTVLTSV